MPAAASKPTLHEAMLAVQKEARGLNLPKNKVNPHFNASYTDLDTVLSEVVPLLNEHEFVLVQFPSLGVGVEPTLTTQFIYVPTGETLEFKMLLMPGRRDPQGQGAAITYAKRYAIMAILAINSDQDDDGNSSGRAENNPSSLSGSGTVAQEMNFNGESPI